MEILRATESGEIFPVWEALHADGTVAARWREENMSPEYIKECAAKYHPKLKLRRLTWVKTVEWVD